jgi:hypothetical protein
MHTTRIQRNQIFTTIIRRCRSNRIKYCTGGNERTAGLSVTVSTLPSPTSSLDAFAFPDESDTDSDPEMSAAVGGRKARRNYKRLRRFALGLVSVCNAFVCILVSYSLISVQCCDHFMLFSIAHWHHGSDDQPSCSFLLFLFAHCAYNITI